MGRGVGIALLVLALASPAFGVYRQGALEMRAKLSVQNTFQHASADAIEWVQERNELRFDLKYDFVPRGQRRFGLRQAQVNLLWRGRYDGAYDLRDRYDRRGYDRDDFRFPEGKLPRELFVDLRFAGALEPLTLRLGKQQVVWGEADLFRSLDVVNPLRLDQNGILGEEFSDYREPLWIAKGLWDLGQVGPIAQAGIEAFYSANGRPLTDRLVFGEELRIKFDNPLDGPNRRPNFVPFDQVRHPWELSRIGPFPTEVFDQADAGLLGNVDVIYLNRNGIPTSTFDFGASMAGIRFLGKTLGGIDLTLNYLFKRTDLPGTSIVFAESFDPALGTGGGVNLRLDRLAEAFAAETSPDADGNGFPDGREALIDRCLEDNEPVYIIGSLRGYPANPLTMCLVKPFHYPWTHIVGGTMTYNDDLTGLILRVETSFSTKEARTAMRPAAGSRAGVFPTARDFATNGIRDTQVWRSMVGFDYLRAFPWMPITRNDTWLLTFQLLNEYYAHVRGQMGNTGSISDRNHHWNPLATFLATGYFVNSRLRPILAAAYDVNDQFPVFWLQGEWFFDQHWTLKAGEVLYAGSRNAESFVFLNKYADRDTFYVQLSYWLL